MTRRARPFSFRGRARTRGASLIEVLVTVLILAMGLLGLAALQTRALKSNISAIQRSQAVMLSHYILDIMRVDRNQARGGSYNTGSDFICAPGGIHSAEPLAQSNLRHWLAEVKNNIGTADDARTCAQVICDAQLVCTVRIRWDDSAAEGSALQPVIVTVSSRL